MPLPYDKTSTTEVFSEPIENYSSKSNSFNLLSVLERNSSTRIILAGHKHINSISNYILPTGKELTQVITGALGYDTSNWRVIKITNDNILIYSPGSSEVEYSISIL